MLKWQQRLELHRRRRPAHWHCQEVPIELSAAIQQATASQCLLVDSLGTWLANSLEQSPTVWARQVAAFLDAIASTPCDLILVAEEVGWGVVPAYPVGRTFRDRLGNLCRQVGAIANPVYLVTGGYALDLKALGAPIPEYRPSTGHASTSGKG
jgi:adenosylcobinamide kinase/adenosylcobinamide-phosphate guanylyltransferase